MTEIIIEHLTVRYSDGAESLRDVSMEMKGNAINVLFGPAGGGKSTLLRTMNRLNDLADVSEVSGKILLNGVNILDSEVDVIDLRRRVGILFSRPIPLPLSIYENVCYGLRMAGIRKKSVLDEAVEWGLRMAVLWDEVNDRLNDPANSLSGGQQQRLCLARTLALRPEVVMLDEPTSALDPVSTARIESLLMELKQQFTIILAPHNTQQAARMADFAGFFLQGELIETGDSGIFTNPRDKRTQEYIEGRFG
ncbi:MAG: phosphate ABC transporter ATP-binding protein [Chloroflexi bacterium]|nr:phosphate ABC transporter ATP-binding protein [Chloroflexota bacterium]